VQAVREIEPASIELENQDAVAHLSQSTAKDKIKQVYIAIACVGVINLENEADLPRSTRAPSAL
jgi:hypothetical protein